MGLGGFIWALASIPLVVWILLRPGLELPPGIILFVLYVVWAGFTVVMLDSFTRLLAFGLRYGVYVTAIGLAVYVYNERRVSRVTFIDWVAILWVWAILGGYLGLLLPRARLSVTPASLLLPTVITSNEFVGNLVRPRFAQVQDIFGIAVPRPSTLWAFTNEWGGNVGLLTPFFIAATLYSANAWRRQAGFVGLVVAVPVMMLSVNRGLWLSIVMILAVVAVRSFLAGRTAPLKALAGGIVVVAALLALTPIGSIVAGRLSESSADSRAGIYQEAWDGALESPILGRGGPRPSENPFSPSVGTHGHLWFAMFSHGLVGLALYVGWLINAMYLANRRHDPVSIMLTSVVYMGALQMFFYNMFGGSLPIILIAIGLLARPDDRFASSSVQAVALRRTPRLMSAVRQNLSGRAVVSYHRWDAPRNGAT
jgi:O-antigen ligase